MRRLLKKKDPKKKQVPTESGNDMLPYGTPTPKKKNFWGKVKKKGKSKSMADVVDAAVSMAITEPTSIVEPKAQADDKDLVLADNLVSKNSVASQEEDISTSVARHELCIEGTDITDTTSSLEPTTGNTNGEHNGAEGTGNEVPQPADGSEVEDKSVGFATAPQSPPPKSRRASDHGERVDQAEFLDQDPEMLEAVMDHAVSLGMDLEQDREFFWYVGALPLCTFSYCGCPSNAICDSLDLPSLAGLRRTPCWRLLQRVGRRARRSRGTSTTSTRV